MEPVECYVQRRGTASGFFIGDVDAHPNYVLTSALKEIAASGRGREPGGARFGQIVLAAPDLAGDTLVEFAKRATGLSSRFTVNASEKDDALILSHPLHSSWRAGQVAGLVTPGVDTIDATSVSTDLIGHNYFGANNSIISDAKNLSSFAGYHCS